MEENKLDTVTFCKLMDMFEDAAANTLKDINEGGWGAAFARSFSGAGKTARFFRSNSLYIPVVAAEKLSLSLIQLHFNSLGT